ncbi:MAG: hypothetical protein ACLRR3_15450 [Eubacterium sp.]
MEEKENLLKNIRGKLEELNIPVYYGIADSSVKDKSEFIVFGRTDINVNQNATAHTRHFEVVIVSKDWVADELISQVVAKAKEVGLRVSTNTDIGIDYEQKNDVPYELVSIPFKYVERVDY